MQKIEYIAPDWDVIYEMIEEIGPLFTDCCFDDDVEEVTVFNKPRQIF